MHITFFPLLMLLRNATIYGSDLGPNCWQGLSPIEKYNSRLDRPSEWHKTAPSNVNQHKPEISYSKLLVLELAEVTSYTQNSEWNAIRKLWFGLKHTVPILFYW